MTRRFDIKRMRGAEFEAALRDLDMKPSTFARLFGIGEVQLIRRWIDEEQNIPFWVSPVLHMLHVPGAIGAARQGAAEQIEKDRLHPEHGSFPFLEQSNA